MKRLALLGVTAFLGIGALACGGGGVEQAPSTPRLVLQADTSRLPPSSDLGATLGIVGDAVRQRLESYGAGPAKVERQGADQLTVTLGSPVSEDEARELLEGRVKLELRQPVTDADGLIVCEEPGAVRFSVPTDKITYARSGTRVLPVCVGGQGQAGQIVWEPALPASRQGGPPPVIQPISATVDRTEAPILVLSFTPENGDLIREITAGLVGLPLGIFLNGELAAGPTLSSPVATANLALPGLSLHEANILAAQINGGELLLPVKVVSVEQAP